MSIGEILVNLFKVGTQIRVGLETFDRIVVTAKEAVDLVTKGEWEDHPAKAAYVALSDEDKEKTEAPHGCGLLTTCAHFDHDALIQEIGGDTKAAPPAAPAKPAAPKKAKAPAKAKKPPVTKPEDTAQDETQDAGEGEGDDAEKHEDGDSNEG